MTRALLALGLVVAVGGLGVLWWRQIGPATAASPERQPITGPVTSSVPIAAPEATVNDARATPSVSEATNSRETVEARSATTPVLTGRVLEEGTLTPLDGAAVVLGSKREEYARATTDKEGKFEFTQARKAGLRIWVEPMEGWEPAQDDLRVKLSQWGKGELTLLLERQNTTTESLPGRVVNDLGLPVETARVEARPIGPDLDVISAQVADGAFQFEGLEKGEWEVVAFGGGNTRSPPVIVEVHTNTGVPTLVLPRAATVIGRVESSFGTPVASASLNVWYSGEGAPSLRSRASAPRATTDERGQFLIDGVMPGTFRLKAHHSDYAEGEWTEMTVVPGERKEGLRLVLGSGGRIEGFVDPSLGTVSDRLINIFSFRGREGWLDTKTDRDGNFEFENVVPQDYIIELRPEGYPSNTSDESTGIRTRITVEEGETTEVAFRAERPITISGTVNSNGVPLEGVRVYAQPQGSVPDQQDECTTGADGGFKLVVAGPGRFWLTVTMNQGSYHYFDVTVQDSDATEFLVVLNKFPSGLT